MNEFVRKTTDEMITVMLEEKNGKKIQARCVPDGEWVDVQFPCGWNWVHFDYRVKPVEPRKIWVRIYCDGTMTAHSDKIMRDIVTSLGLSYGEFIELTPEIKVKLGLP